MKQKSLNFQKSHYRGYDSEKHFHSCSYSSEANSMFDFELVYYLMSEALARRPHSSTEGAH